MRHRGKLGKVKGEPGPIFWEERSMEVANGQSLEGLEHWE